MSDNAMNDKLQGSAASYLRCGGSVINDVNKGLLLSLPVKKMEIGTHLAKNTSKNVAVSRTLYTWSPHC